MWFLYHRQKSGWPLLREGGCTSEEKMCTSMGQLMGAQVASVSLKIEGRQYLILKLAEPGSLRQWRKMRLEQRESSRMPRGEKILRPLRGRSQRSFRPARKTSVWKTLKEDHREQAVRMIRRQKSLKIHKREQTLKDRRCPCHRQQSRKQNRKLSHSQ